MAGHLATGETAPLLGAERTDSNGSPQTINIASRLREHWQKWKTFYVCALLVTTIDVPAYMGAAPQLRMLELGVCREFYATHDPSVIDGNGDIPEHLCKLSSIQSSLAKMRGIMAALEAIPGIVLGIPFGILADAKGRRLVLFICLIGFVLRDLWMFLTLFFYRTFPLKMVYAVPALAILGGGAPVAASMVLAIIAASLSQHSRTQAFFMIQVALLVSELVSPPIASFLMRTIGAHFTFLAQVPIEACGFILLYFLPGNEPKTRDAAYDRLQEASGDSWLWKAGGRVRRCLRDIRGDMSTIFAQKRMLVTLGGMLVAKMARPILDVTMQFMSNKFGWPIHKTAYIFSIQAATQLPWYVVVMPALNAWLLRVKGNAVSASRTLAIMLVFCLGLGTLAMGLAPTAEFLIAALILYNAGCGYPAAMRSLVTALVPDDQLSILFTSITVFESIATLGAAPLLQLSYSWGVERGGLMQSVPYFITTALYCLAGLALCVTTFVTPHTNVA